MLLRLKRDLSADTMYGRRSLFQSTSSFKSVPVVVLEMIGRQDVVYIDMLGWIALDTSLQV